MAALISAFTGTPIDKLIAQPAEAPSPEALLRKVEMANAAFGGEDTRPQNGNTG